MEKQKATEEIPILHNSITQEVLIKDLKHALTEVELHAKGDIKLQRARDFLIEWSESSE